MNYPNRPKTLVSELTRSDVRGVDMVSTQGKVLTLRSIHCTDKILYYTSLLMSGMRPTNKTGGFSRTSIMKDEERSYSVLDNPLFLLSTPSFDDDFNHYKIHNRNSSRAYGQF